MAESSISVDQDQITCPVCLDLLKDPVTIPCGHSYCMSCITDCWNQEDQKRISEEDLRSLSSLSLSGSTDGFTVSSHLSFDEVVKSVSQLRDKLQEFCSEETDKISRRVKTIQIILAPEYQTREEFLQSLQ